MSKKTLLNDAVDDFRLFRISDGKKPNTLRGDRATLKAFMALTGNIYAHSCHERHVTEFLAKRAQTRGQNSLNGDLTVLSVFFDWCRRTRRIPPGCDPLAGRKTRVVHVPERTRVHMSKFPKLLSAAEEIHPRNRAVVAIGLYTLLRGSEIQTLKVSDLDLADGFLRATIHKKGGLEDRIPVYAALDRELRAWLTFYAAACGPLQPQWYLTPARYARPISDQRTGVIVRVDTELRPTRRLGQVSHIVNPALAATGVALTDDEGRPTREGGHTLRRSGARALFDMLCETGARDPLGVVQSMLHHQSRAQSEVYIGLDPTRQERDTLLKGAVLFDAPENVIELPTKAAGE